MITYKRSFVMLVLLPFGSYFFMNLGFFFIPWPMMKVKLWDYILILSLNLYWLIIINTLDLALQGWMYNCITICRWNSVWRSKVGSEYCLLKVSAYFIKCMRKKKPKWILKNTYCLLIFALRFLYRNDICVFHRQMQ